MDLAQKPVYKLDLAAGTSVVNLTTPLVEGDDRAQTFTLELTDKGTPANLDGYSVTAYFGRGKTAEAEADTIPLSGTVSGNVATITLTESCYSRSCYFSMPIRLSNGATGQKRTYLIVRGTVVKSVDGTIIDPDGSVPSLDDLFAQIAVMERSRQAAEEATEEALAAAARADEAREGIQGDLAALTEEIDFNSRMVGLLADNAVISGDEIAFAMNRGFAINAYGNMVELDSGDRSYVVSDPISVSPGDLLCISCAMKFGQGMYAFYDAAGGLLSIKLAEAGAALTSIIDEFVVVPENAATMRQGYITGNARRLTKNVVLPIVPESVADKSIMYRNLDDRIAAAFTDGEYEEVTFDYVNKNQYVQVGDGAFVDYNGVNHTDYIDCSAYEKIWVQGRGYYSACVLAVYDSGKHCIATYPQGSGYIYVDEKIILPENAKYIVVSEMPGVSTVPTVVKSLVSYVPVPSGKVWVGQKWVCIGDSLTERNGRTTKNYHDYVAQRTGITVINMGMSGTGYARQQESGNAFYQRIANSPADADVVTIFGSGNDLGAGLELGTPADTGTETLCGCVNTTIDNLIALMPAVSLGIVSPTPWVGYSPADAENAMAKYSNALKTICERRSIPFLDLYHCSNLRPWTEEGRAACYTKDDGNGVHPDETGHKLIAARFKAFLESLIM